MTGVFRFGLPSSMQIIGPQDPLIFMVSYSRKILSITINIFSAIFYLNMWYIHLIASNINGVITLVAILICTTWQIATFIIT